MAEAALQASAVLSEPGATNCLLPPFDGFSALPSFH